MRLGEQVCMLMPDSKIQSIYREESIKERHRHRYEINNTYLEAIRASGLYIGGRSQDLQLIETVERADHPWYIGVQFHPEFASRPFAAHPLYVSFVKTCMDRVRSNS